MVNQQPIQPLAPSDTSSQSFSSQPSRKLNKTLLAIVSIIGGVLIIGGGALAYSKYFQPPEKIVQKMAAKLTEIKSLEYSGEIKAKVNAISTSNKKSSDFSINFTGSSDIQNPNNPKGQFSFNIKTDALQQKEFTFGLEIKTIDKIIYAKLSDAPNLGFSNLSAVKNQWIKIDPETLKKQFGLEKLDEQIKEARKKSELTPEQIEKLKTAVQQDKIFKITGKLANEKIEGINTYHYKFAINKEGVKKLFADISQIIQNKTLTEKELAEFDKKLEAAQLPEGEIWIGKKDLLPYKITLNSIIKETDKSKISGEISFTLLLKNFNKPVQIDIPQQTKPLEEFLKELIGGLQNLAPNNTFPTVNQQHFNKGMNQAAGERARDAKRQAGLYQIRLELELYYDKHNKYPFSLNEISPKYLLSMPVDPKTNIPYQYQLQPDGKDYKVCAQLEFTKTQKCVTSRF